MRKETELCEMSEHLTSQAIDEQIAEVASESLSFVTMQVDTSKAIDDRMNELSEEIVEKE